MELYIQVREGKPFEHPIFGDNLRQAFPGIDLDNLPPEFIKFERVPAPVIGPYEKNLRQVYEIQSDGVCRDVWYKDQMTQDEIATKQEAVKQSWKNNNGAASWVFNVDMCIFQPPVPMPEPNSPPYYFWNETSQSWIQVPIQP